MYNERIDLYTGYFKNTACGGRFFLFFAYI
nr:MAG TPA: hypothetical protein [Caudoviricetes sp.]